MKIPAFIVQQHPLAQLSGFKTGGPARFFLGTASEAELQQGLAWANYHDIKLFFLGKGTNVLFPDLELDCLVVQWSKEKSTINSQNELVVGSGAELESIVNYALENGISGFAWAAGLPGSVGAAVRGNVGAFGHDISSVFQWADCLDVKRTDQVFRLTKDEMNFGYRSSKVKETGYFVLRVAFQVQQGSSVEMKEQIELAERCRAFRQERHPLEHPNCGSVFKNIEDAAAVARLVSQVPEWQEMQEKRWYGKIPAAAILEAVGLKNHRIGGAAFSSRHANFIVNDKGASSADILNLILLAQQKVQDAFGIHLEPEIQILIANRAQVI
jgi:UDP-N-acetylmuramate dehydrogenase